MAAQHFEVEDEHRRARAITHCRTSKSAVTLIVWPTGNSQVEVARGFLTDCGVEIIYDGEVGPMTTDMQQIKTVLGIYAGEEWLTTNCWYFESPLPSGKPKGAFPGAKWKKELCFKTDAPLYVFVGDAAQANVDIWGAKYKVRQLMAKATNNDGNVCMHLSDNQADVIGSRGITAATSSGFSCDSSYAFHTSRLLLNPFSLEYILGKSELSDLSTTEFKETLNAYTNWLSDFSWVDYETQEGEQVGKSSKCKIVWNRPSCIS